MKLLSNIKTKWENFCKFCGLLRISELYLSSDVIKGLFNKRRLSRDGKEIVLLSKSSLPVPCDQPKMSNSGSFAWIQLRIF